MDIKQWGAPHTGWLIELLLYWEGQINSSSLTNVFDVTRQTASKWIKTYLSEAGLNVDYQPQTKAFHVPTGIERHYISGAIDEYLDWCQLGLFPNLNINSKGSSTYIKRITFPKRFVSSSVIQPLIKALRQGVAVDVKYLSISSNSAKERLIYPHTFVKAANRWHVRAYCELAQQFRDFVLSRFISVDFDGTATTYKVQDDKAWNSQVEIILQPDPRLTPQQKSIIEHDYGMQDGQLVVVTKGALVKYTLDDLQIKTKMLEVNPEAQQLVCVNYVDIKPWLYE